MSVLHIPTQCVYGYGRSFVRMFGFDVYAGVYHRLWFKRKSLICDLVEPFRCIIDRTVRTTYNRKQFTTKDFTIHKGEYRLKIENRVLENLMLKIDQFATKFDGGDSVIVFEVSDVKLKKYGNAIHRDADIVYL